MLGCECFELLLLRLLFYLLCLGVILLLFFCAFASLRVSLVSADIPSLAFFSFSLTLVTCKCSSDCINLIL